jgi:hypothetical protein
VSLSQRPPPDAGSGNAHGVSSAYYGPVGQRVFDVKLSTAPGSVTETAVIYGEGTWWTVTWSVPVLRHRLPPGTPTQQERATRGQITLPNVSGLC